MTESLRGPAQDRPWLANPPSVVNPKTIARWRAVTEATPLPEARPSVTRPEVTDGEPGVTVVVATRPGADGLAGCLRSIAAQSLDRALFEVIVVVEGSTTRGAVDPGDLPVRVVHNNRPGRARAYNSGIAAANREYLTFVDGDDAIAVDYLETLLRHASPPVVPVAQGAGETVGKLVSTALLRAHFFDTELVSGAEVVLWTQVMVGAGVEARPVDTTYHRAGTGPTAEPREPTFESVRHRLDVIARLEPLLDGADPAGAAHVTGRIEAEVAPIAEYLRRHPEDHPRLVELLDRYPIYAMPYSLMNAPLGGRGLVIAYAFPPYADASAVVMAKRVRTRGRIADVVANAMDRIRETDPSTLRISGPFVARHAALATPSYFSDFGSIEKFAVAGLEQIDTWTADHGRYEWLYSRAQFAASHFLAAAHKLRTPDLPWTAEFSDPLSRDVAGAERGTPVADGPLVAALREGMARLGLPVPASPNSFVWCEEIAYALADELVFTNENQMEFMLGYCSDPDVAEMARKKAVIAPHPTLPSEFYSMAEYDYPLEDDLVHVAYFGNFYATRGLDDVLGAIAALDEWSQSRLRVHVFTTKPEELRSRAEALGIGPSVRVGPYVRFLEFLNLTAQFDCLFVNDAVTEGSHTHNPYLPSKWSDYRGSGTAVWAQIEEGSPLSRQALAYRSAVGDVAAASEVLRSLIADKLGPAVPA